MLVQTSRPVRFPLLRLVLFYPVRLTFMGILIRIFPEGLVIWKILISL